MVYVAAVQTAAGKTSRSLRAGDDARPRANDYDSGATGTKLPRVAALFDPRSNGITAFRLFLALVVLVFHAWPIGGFGPDPLTQMTGGRLGGGGELAVAGFFGLSGFLLVDSRRRHGTLTFLRRRAFRILPAYWMAIAATAFVVGVWYIPGAWLPFAGVGSAQWTDWSGHPTSLINAPLWSLWPEVVCYTALAILPVRGLRSGLLAAAAILVLLAGIAPGAVFGAGIIFAPTMAFVAGALISIGREHVPLTGPIGVAGLAAAYLTVGTMAGSLILAVSCAYVAIWAGLRLPFRWKADLSYGCYILAFPVAQVLVSAGVAATGPLGLAMMTAIVTLPIAAASWHLIERPAIRVGAAWAPSWPLMGLHLSTELELGSAIAHAPGDQPAAATSEGRTTRAPSS